MSIRANVQQRTRFLTLCLLLLPYVLYLAFTIQLNRGPVDYETFMDIGTRFRTGGVVYSENSFYPLPYVLVFAFFSVLPRWLSLALWLGLPVLAAVLITRGQPLVLLFAPLLSHFLGGQTVLFGLLGLWGYRRWQHEPIGGLWLALTMLKPQLAIFPGLWAAGQWFQILVRERRIPVQALVFAAVTAAIYLPAFVIMPGWVSEWLASPRPLTERAMSSLVPRALLVLVGGRSPLFWPLLVGIALALFAVLRSAGKLTLDRWLLFSFIVNPLVNDYDLLQIVSLLADVDRSIPGSRAYLRRAGVVLSIPGILVILFAYASNQAWVVYTIIAPGLLLMMVWRERQLLARNASGTSHS